MKLAAFLLSLMLATQVVFAEPDNRPTPANEELMVIVNGDNPITSISENDLRDYFFKRKRQWADGTTVRFLDRAQDTGVRKIFLKNVIKKSSEDVDLYWIGQKLYSGDSAPLRESSEAMTVQFVASFKGAIGYVSSAAVLNGKNVKSVKVE